MKPVTFDIDNVLSGGFLSQLIVLIAGTILLALLFLPLVVYAGNNSSYDLNSSINDQSADQSNHTHSNTTENSTNSTEHIHANLTLTSAFTKNGTGAATVILEDFEKNNPVNVHPHGLHVRFFRLGTQNISFESVSISAAYCEMDLNGINEKNLSLFIYENSTWVKLPTNVNEEDNILNASARSLSLFAISSHSENTSEHIHNDTVQTVKSHDGEEMGDETISASFIGKEKTEFTLEVNSNDMPDSPAPGSPVKFFSISARNFSYSGVNIKVIYNDAEFAKVNESNLSIIHYTNSTWVTLPTEVNATKNTLRSFTGSLSPFAISDLSGTGSMGMGIISNCLRCHGTNGTKLEQEMMEEMVPKIDPDIMNQSIHTNLNNASSNLNRACWACHANSTTPPKKHPMHKPALTCTSCHVNSSEKFNSPFTTEHTPHAANITVNATCQLCHGKPQMINLNGSTLNSTISHYGKKRPDMLDSNRTGTNCSYCHQNPVSEFSDVFNKTSRTNITHNVGLSCSSCHGTGRLHNSTLVNMQGYSLSNCVQCHGTSGFASNKVSESTINQSIHANVNDARSDLNRACWSCHSNMITTPQDHPDIAKPPNTCSSCHIDGVLNLAGNIKRGHISSHSPGSSHIRTPVCTTCHINDIIASGKNANSTVSHYAKYPTVDTRDCISCHQNREISKKWGNPLDPRETIRLSNIEKKLVSDEVWRINEKYSIAIADIDKQGKSVWIELYYNGLLIKDELVPEGGGFKYGTKLMQEGENKTIIDLRIPEIFYGGMVSLITFNGYVPTHVHTETTSVQCYACHVKEYRSDKPDGQKYFVLKKDEPNVTLNPIDIDFDASDKKTLYSNNSWDLGSGYELHMKDFSPDRKYVWLALTKDNIEVKEEFVTEGEYFTYNTTLNGEDIMMLRLKVANIFIKG